MWKLTFDIAEIEHSFFKHIWAGKQIDLDLSALEESSLYGRLNEYSFTQNVAVITVYLVMTTTWSVRLWEVPVSKCAIILFWLVSLDKKSTFCRSINLSMLLMTFFSLPSQLQFFHLLLRLPMDQGQVVNSKPSL